MPKIIFQENHIHSTYSDGQHTLAEIFEYNQLHDKLDLIITDHVDRKTNWFTKYAKEIRELRKLYKDFSVKIGCEVKIISESGDLNATDELLREAEFVVGSVHHFSGIKTMKPDELFKKEYELSRLLAVNKKIDILGHPFSMGMRFFGFNPDISLVESVYRLCIKNGIKFEYSKKNSPENIKKFLQMELTKGHINNFSFGSDVHKDISELGASAFDIVPPVNILITGAGAGVGQSLIKSAKLSNMKVRIITVDNDPLAAGLYTSDAAYLVPLKGDPNFIERIIDICRKEKVDILFPGTDVELETLSSNKMKIESMTSAKVIVSKVGSIRVADDKWRTYLFLKKNGFPYPKSWLSDSTEIKKLKFPVIVKPRNGARSIGVSIVKNKEELSTTLNATENPIIQEFLPQENQEFTCGSFFYNNKNYGVITAKRWLRNGDTYKAIFDHDIELEKFIAKVGSRLGVVGPCNFQLRKTNKGPVIFEINCRFSGTTGAASYLGFNVVNALIQKVVFRRPLKKLTFRESYMFRYWNETFTSKAEVLKITSSKQTQLPLSEKNIF